MKNDLAAFNTNDYIGADDERGREAALKLFHKATSRVPAYKEYLAEMGVNPEKIRTYDDFVKHVPIIDKENYISKYPLEKLCLDGDIFNNNIISTSSGSTGKPFFWPRGVQQNADNTEFFIRVYDDSFEMNKKKTLLVICFSLGTWIGGTLTLESSLDYANIPGNRVNIVTPGIDKVSAISSIKKLGSFYEQIVIAAYPPFAKDIIDHGIQEGIDWAKLNVKFLMGGESYSEEWRDYILELAGSNRPCYDTVDAIAASDIGVVGYETPLSILIRRTYSNNHVEACRMFGSDLTPSIVQFNPMKRHIECVKGDIVVTSNSGIPLVRYNIKDTGEVISKKDMMAPVYKELEKNAEQEKVDLSGWNLPFLYINGRKDFVATLYGVNIYPENIKSALIDPRVRKMASGKFTIATGNDKNMDQYLDINVELAKDVDLTPEVKKAIKNAVLEKLIAVNSEFRKLHSVVGAKADIRIHLFEFGNKEYFAPGAKHKWIKKGGV